MYDGEAFPTIQIGTAIVHYHALRKFDAPALRKLFIPLPPEDVFALKRGDFVFVDPGPLRRGAYAVYGWVKAEITDARYVHGGRWRICYAANRRKGSLRVELDGFCPDISWPDEAEVIALLGSFPDALRV